MYSPGLVPFSNVTPPEEDPDIIPTGPDASVGTVMRTIRDCESSSSSLRRTVIDSVALASSAIVMFSTST